MRYTRDADKAIHMIDSGNRQIAFLLDRIAVKSVMDISRRGGDDASESYLLLSQAPERVGDEEDGAGMIERSNITRLSTGNEFVSIPDISIPSAGIRTIGFMHKAYRACIEINGSDRLPLLRPVVLAEGEDIFGAGERRASWTATGYRVSGRALPK